MLQKHLHYLLPKLFLRTETLYPLNNNFIAHPARPRQTLTHFLSLWWRRVSELHSFPWLNDILLHVHNTLALPIRLLIDIRVIPISWLFYTIGFISVSVFKKKRKFVELA